jgi:hypothetical protein
MKKGFSYVYEVSVKTGNGSKPGDNNLIEPIVVNVQELENWDEDEESNDWYKYPIGEIVDKDEVRAYDYAMSDGSFVSSTSTLTQRQKGNCIGVVFYTVKEGGSVLTDDKVLQRDYPDCTHGLIASLKFLTDSEGNNKILWQGEDTDYRDNRQVEDIWANFQKEHEIYGNEPYISIQTILKKLFDGNTLNMERYLASPIVKILGYNNTEVLKAYNETNPTYPVNPINALLKAYKDGTLQDCNRFSSWFIPSLNELEILGCGWEGDTTPVNFVALNEAFKQLDSTSYDELEMGDYGLYWSSSECEDYLAYEGVFLENIVITGDQPKQNGQLVRPICAF